MCSASMVVVRMLYNHKILSPSHSTPLCPRHGYIAALQCIARCFVEILDVAR